MKDLETFLKNDSNSIESNIDVIDKIQEKYDITKEPKVFISKTDEFFIDVMKKLKENENSGNTKFSIKPLFNDDNEIDGAFISFNKKF